MTIIKKWLPQEVNITYLFIINIMFWYVMANHVMIFRATTRASFQTLQIANIRSEFKIVNWCDGLSFYRYFILFRLSYRDDADSTSLHSGTGTPPHQLSHYSKWVYCSFIFGLKVTSLNLSLDWILTPVLFLCAKQPIQVTFVLLIIWNMVLLSTQLTHCQLTNMLLLVFQ